MQMPFPLRAIFQSNVNCNSECKEYFSFIIPESFVHMAQAAKHHDGIFLVSAKVCLKIKEAPSRDILLLPRTLYDLKPQDPPGFVELFLYDFKYIGGFDPEKKTTMMHYALSKSPIALQEAWVNFKEVFFKDDRETKIIKN
jgi:hypothetical protein